MSSVSNSPFDGSTNPYDPNSEAYDPSIANGSGSSGSSSGAAASPAPKVSIEGGGSGAGAITAADSIYDGSTDPYDPDSEFYDPALAKGWKTQGSNANSVSEIPANLGVNKVSGDDISPINLLAKHASQGQIEASRNRKLRIRGKTMI